MWHERAVGGADGGGAVMREPGCGWGIPVRDTHLRGLYLVW